MTNTWNIARYGNKYRPLVMFGAVIAFLVSLSPIAEGATNCTGACVTGFNNCNA